MAKAEHIFLEQQKHFLNLEFRKATNTNIFKIKVWLNGLYKQNSVQ